MTYQEYNEKLKRGLAQVRAGQGIVKTMEELERRAEETDLHSLSYQTRRTLIRTLGCFWRAGAFMLASVSRRCSRMGCMILPWR